MRCTWQHVLAKAEISDDLIYRSDMVLFVRPFSFGMVLFGRPCGFFFEKNFEFTILAFN